VRKLLTGSAPDIAPALLGSVLVSRVGGVEASVVLSEVEAYTADDPASHSYRGRTRTNGSMFGRPGTLYVYRSCGIHWCMNVTTGPVGEASAILLRAGVVLTGRGLMEKRRGRPDHLCDGPGKLAQALGVTGEHDGLDVCDADSPIRLHPGRPVATQATRRIGISRAVDVPWRWVAIGPVLSHSPDTQADDHD